MATDKKTKRIFTGEVVSASTAKTLVVKVERMKLHPKYNKSFRVTKKYHVHDEASVAKAGDKIHFEECRPFSKTKRWRLIEVIK